jgi:hypothetical protein
MASLYPVDAASGCRNTHLALGERIDKIILQPLLCTRTSAPLSNHVRAQNLTCVNKYMLRIR